VNSKYDLNRAKEWIVDQRISFFGGLCKSDDIKLRILVCIF